MVRISFSGIYRSLKILGIKILCITSVGLKEIIARVNFIADCPSPSNHMIRVKLVLSQLPFYHFLQRDDYHDNHRTYVHL